jgi:DNA-directed RNA polymerase alpha subunit
MEIWTDGSIDALYALKLAAKDLINSFSQIADPKEFEDEVVTISAPTAQQGNDISVEEIELPLRVTNALKKAGYGTIDALIKAGRLDVSKAKNVGEKSLKVIDAWLKERGFTWK